MYGNDWSKIDLNSLSNMSEREKRELQKTLERYNKNLEEYNARERAKEAERKQREYAAYQKEAEIRRQEKAVVQLQQTAELRELFFAKQDAATARKEYRKAKWTLKRLTRQVDEDSPDPEITAARKAVDAAYQKYLDNKQIVADMVAESPYLKRKAQKEWRTRIMWIIIISFLLIALFLD